ncbi:KilA-N domain-containing protein [Desulfoluna spongiiphila]|uniref:KilA-N domain-containing protein n=1 Tax=Desulfoluna spongiiphila TaxID=419481 RepID=A0A1G5ADH5_9BACT|nr:KilA-N domain-containing protein [Desulfoluna spongiiphila]SCX75953.1 KilA-N domain-containing protein [Desulfoluna spongiiphila]
MNDILGTYNDTQIVFTDDNLINLTQMHKAVDGRMSQAPAQWLRHKDTKNFLKSLCNKLDVCEEHIITSIKGRGKAQGTYAHWQIALAYAKYLSPEFHIQCNEWIKERFEFEADPEKAVDHYYDKLEAKYRSRGWSPEKIEARMKGRLCRRQFDSTARTMGATRNGMKTASNMINQFVTGMDTAELRKTRNVKETRDGLTLAELAVINAIEAIASEQIDKRMCQTFEATNDRDLIKIVGPLAKTFGQALHNQGTTIG